MSDTSKLPTNIKSQAIVRGTIADSSGHTDFTGTVDEAMATITDQVKKFGKWVMVEGAPEILNQDPSPEELQGLRRKLEAGQEFTVTGKLVGGKAKVEVTICGNATSRKIDRTPQIAICGRTRGDTTSYKVIVSGRSKKNLKSDFASITKAIEEALA